MKYVAVLTQRLARLEFSACFRFVPTRRGRDWEIFAPAFPGKCNPALMISSPEILSHFWNFVGRPSRVTDRCRAVAAVAAT